MKDIYFPEEDSFLLEKYVKKYARGVVLDIGTGSGIQAISAAKKKNVKKVYALDINKDSIKFLKDKIKKDKIKKIGVMHSNLFSKFKNKNIKFDTIIFNPPYLPHDKKETGGISKANSGGKHGYELLVQFIKKTNKYLKKGGQILIIFSSITNQDKINETIKMNLLTKKELEEKSLFMEKLIVYKLEKSKILEKIEDKKISDINYLAEGKRGVIYTGRYSGKKVAIKIKKKKSEAVNTIKKEEEYLNLLKVGPKFYFSTKNFLVREYIDGEFFIDYINKYPREKVKLILEKILERIEKMDKLKVNKEEMHRPIKHIIIRKNIPYFIDFERCHKTQKPKNMTQFLSFLANKETIETLNKKGFKINREKTIDISRVYLEGKINSKKIIEMLKK